MRAVSFCFFLLSWLCTFRLYVDDLLFSLFKCCIFMQVLLPLKLCFVYSLIHITLLPGPTAMAWNLMPCETSSLKFEFLWVVNTEQWHVNFLISMWMACSWQYRERINPRCVQAWPELACSWPYRERINPRCVQAWPEYRLPLKKNKIKYNLIIYYPRLYYRLIGS